MDAKKISAEDVMCMEYLRGQGLSNSQIAHDMGLNTSTIYKYIGSQGKKVRAAYGSIVSHPENEKYFKNDQISAPDTPTNGDLVWTNVAEPDWANIKPAKPSLKKTGSLVTYKGELFNYLVDSNEDTTIVTIEYANKDITPNELHFSIEGLKNFINELCDLTIEISKGDNVHE